MIESHGCFNEDVTHLSYLPLAYMYEKLCRTLVYMHGGKIGFYSGDVDKVTDAAQALRPNMFLSVPHFYNGIHHKVTSSLQQASFLRRALFNMATKRKRAELNRGIIRRNSIWDKLVLRQIQGLLGGKVDLMFSGAAPLAPDTLQFLRCAFGAHVIIGYGQTETATAATFTLPGDHRADSVGAPMPCTMIKLVDVPHYTEQNRGEICFKGPNIFQGYLNNPEKTDEALDTDGWLCSGDIGEWLPNGTLKLIGRKNDIFKLQQGGYIAPERIEAIYLRSPFVFQMLCMETASRILWLVL